MKPVRRRVDKNWSKVRDRISKIVAVMTPNSRGSAPNARTAEEPRFWTNVGRVYLIVGIPGALAGIAMLWLFVLRAEKPPQRTNERQVNVGENSNSTPSREAPRTLGAGSGNANSSRGLSNGSNPPGEGSNDDVASEKTVRRGNNEPTPAVSGSNSGKPGTRIGDYKAKLQQIQSLPGLPPPASTQASAADLRSEHRSTADETLPQQPKPQPTTLSQPTHVTTEDPVATQRIEPAPPRPNPTRSGGVVQGRAVFMPQPPYPSDAKHAKVEGVVVVEVQISKEGKVLSARALSGHERLRDAAVRTAMLWKYESTLLSGKPARASTTITFHFKLK